MFILDYKTKIPIYEQIQNQVVNFIALGLLKPNQQLPAVRQLASDLGVNPNTVAKAYQELEKQGYIVSQTGRGSFISDSKEALTSLKKDYLEELKQLLLKMKAINISRLDINNLVQLVYQEGGFQ